MKTTIITLEQQRKAKAHAGCLVEMPPKVEKALAYAIAYRRGPSVGKSSWKPGGTAHKTHLEQTITAKGRTYTYSVDNVTGKRVKLILHDVTMRGHLKSQQVEAAIRRLCYKAANGGLTTKEFEKLELLQHDIVVEQNYHLAELLDRTFFRPNDKGRLVTNRRYTCAR